MVAQTPSAFAPEVVVAASAVPVLAFRHCAVVFEVHTAVVGCLELVVVVDAAFLEVSSKH